MLKTYKLFGTEKQMRWHEMLHQTSEVKAALNRCHAKVVVDQLVTI